MVEDDFNITINH